MVPHHAGRVQRGITAALWHGRMTRHGRLGRQQAGGASIRRSRRPACGWTRFRGSQAEGAHDGRRSGNAPVRRTIRL